MVENKRLPKKKKSACLPFWVWPRMGSSPKTDGEASQKCSLPLGTCGFPHHYITVNSWMSEIGDNNFQMLAAQAIAGTCWMGTVIWQRGEEVREIRTKMWQGEKWIWTGIELVALVCFALYRALMMTVWEVETRHECACMCRRDREWKAN